MRNYTQIRCLVRPGTILPFVREITRIKSEMCKRSIQVADKDTDILITDYS